PLTRPPRPALFPYTTLFRSAGLGDSEAVPEAALGAALVHLDRVLGEGFAALEVADDDLLAGDEGDDGARHLRLAEDLHVLADVEDRKSTRLNSSHRTSSYAV